VRSFRLRAKNDIVRIARASTGQAIVAIVAALAGWSCDPGAVTVELPAYDPATDAYSLTPVEIETLDDLGKLEGRATTLVGGAEVLLDYQQGFLKWKAPGHSVAFSAFEADGVLIPEDFDSLAMAAVYYNIELSLLFFEALGLPVNELLVPMNTYYWADFEIVETDGESTEMADNAFYMYVSENDRSFFVFPYDQFQWLPMSMNAGIMTHEYTHAVFDALVYDPTRGAVLQPSAANFLQGLNEGMADTMAVARTGDPDYIAHSVPKGVFVAQCNDSGWKEIVRDASLSISYSYAFDSAARSVPSDRFCPYDIGSFVSSLMYALAASIDDSSAGQGAIPAPEARLQVAGYALEALDLLGQSLSNDFELYDFFSFFASVIDTDSHLDTFCGLLGQRYSMWFSEVSGC
jgi:hypothetical protein